MGMQLMTIGPEEAATLLKLNHNNRKRNQNTVIRYASDMAAGRWRNVGDPIRFNGTRLFDGQHRLAAIVMSGVQLEMYVIDGLTEDDMSVIDTGKPRSLNDTLQWAGAKNVSVTAGVTRRLCGLSNGYSLRDTGLLARMSKSEQLEFYEANADIIEWAALCGVRLNSRLGNGKIAWATGIGYLAMNGAPLASIEAFVTAMCEGVGLTSTSPILSFRRWATEVVVQRKKLRHDELLIATVKAYNAWRNGAELKLIKVTATEQIQPVVVD